MKVDAFFEGGGILGVSYIGAYKALTERGIFLDKVVGISSGALVSSLIVAGFSGRELMELVASFDFNCLRKKTEIAKKNYIGKPLSLLYEKGIHDSKVIEEFMNEILSIRNVHSFKDVMFNGESKLKIIATDITNKRLMLIPDDLPHVYGIDPYYFSIALAVRMSCAIPFYYTPIELNLKNKNCYIVDGCVCRNIPTTIINRENELKKLSLRFKIKGNGNIINRLSSVKIPLLNKNLEPEPLEKTIIIQNTSDIKATDFDISREQIYYLYNIGYQAALQFIRELEE